MKDFVSGGPFGVSALASSLALTTVAASLLAYDGLLGLALGSIGLASLAMLSRGLTVAHSLVHVAGSPVAGVPSVGPEARYGGPPAWPMWGCGLRAGGRI